jgi:hypothetical protein
LARIANAETRGGRKAGTRAKFTEEKDAAIHQLYGEGKAVASIARTVGPTGKGIYRLAESGRPFARSLALAAAMPADCRIRPLFVRSLCSQGRPEEYSGGALAELVKPGPGTARMEEAEPTLSLGDGRSRRSRNGEPGNSGPYSEERGWLWRGGGGQMGWPALLGRDPAAPLIAWGERSLRRMCRRIAIDQDKCENSEDIYGTGTGLYQTTFFSSSKIFSVDRLHPYTAHPSGRSSNSSDPLGDPSPITK